MLHQISLHPKTVMPQGTGEPYRQMTRHGQFTRAALGFGQRSRRIGRLSNWTERGLQPVKLPGNCPLFCSGVRQAILLSCPDPEESVRPPNKRHHLIQRCRGIRPARNKQQSASEGTVHDGCRPKLTVSHTCSGLQDTQPAADVTSVAVVTLHFGVIAGCVRAAEMASLCR
jgi:hypothetical protein